MRKIYIAIPFLFALLFLNTKSDAQLISTYVFAQSTGTYTPISGGTVVATATSNSGATAMDDVNYSLPAASIPFTFTFNGIGYTTLNINSNGFVTFGATAPPTGFPYTPISDNTGYAGAISAYGGDIISVFNLGGATGEIRYAVVGSAPTREFVVQWTNFRPLYTTTTASAYVFDFQIRLSETTNIIKMVYGGTLGFVVGSTAQSGTVQVGLRGPNNTDYVNRNSGAGVAFTASTAGVTNASTQAFNTSANPPGMPTLGLTYTWLPPGPCVSGSLGGGTAQGPAGAVCPGSSVALTVTGASFGTGLTYQWESSPDNSTWTNVGGATATSLTTSVATNTWFRRKITCSGVDAWSTSVQVTVTPPVNTFPYLSSFTSSLPACWFASEQTAGASQHWAATTTDGTHGVTAPQAGSNFAYLYVFLASATYNPYFLTTTAVALDATPKRLRYYYYLGTGGYHGTSGATGADPYPLVVQISTNGGTTWTDLYSHSNTNTTFATNNAVSNWAQNSINLSAYANMNVMVRFKSMSNFGNNFCDQALDEVVFEDLPSCVDPTGLSVTSSTATSANLSWTASVSNPANGYQWEVRTSGAGGSGPAGLVASGNTGAGVTTATANSLTGNTSYNYYVRSDCGGANFSPWAGGFAFTTPCGAIGIPFIETFSTYATTFPPTCWSRNNATYMTGQAVSAYGSGAGSAKFDFYGASSGTQLDLTSPLFTALPAGYFLIFDHAYATFGTEVDQLQVLYSTDGGVTYTTLATYAGGTGGPLNTAGATFASFSPSAGQWATKLIAVPAGTNRLIFRGISAFGNNLYLDNIALTSCLPPTSLGLSAVAPTTATLSWTASGSNPTNGYQWEVRTSGVGGSGATGLVSSGTVGAGVTTVNVTGLTPFTTYTYYVRSDCGGSFSIWAGPYSFTTPCNAIAIPFTENFSTYATTFPPNCWMRNDATYITGQSPSAYGIGLGSARFDFFSANAGTILDLTSPVFAPTPSGWGLVFDHAYATFFGENDQLQILYSTNGGATYTSLITYDGGGGGPLNTAGSVLSAFAPSATQWANKVIALPTGTNRLIFRGISAFGNNLFLDNIALVSCMPVSNVQVSGISPTQLKVTFTGSGGPYYVEYGPTGFVPGTGATAGAGTVLPASGSPFFISGLTASTNYDVYVRRECTAGVDYSINVKGSSATLCPATNIPYLQNFESATVPGMPTCTSRQDINGNSGSFWLGTGGGGWETYTDANPLTYVSPSKALLYFYDFNDLSRGGDDWFYTQGLNLTAGTSYRLKFYYKAIDGVNFPERMEVKYGVLADVATMTNPLFVNNSINSVYASPYDSVRVDFTPATSGVYYIGFHEMSLGDEDGLLLDDISVKTTPLVDVGITGLTLPSVNCPANGVFAQATIRNFNLTTQNFATYPVTVTANITGASTGTLSTVLNTGTLAPGASMSVYLSPSFNFVAGDYVIGTKTISPADSETGNDSTTTSFTVNPAPPTPVITPASPAICIGNPIQLSTQFTASPPPVTMPPVTSGAITVAIPDANVAGASHTLNVSGIPANATVTGISVTLNVSHTWVGDMIINLKGPNNSVLNLFNREGNTINQVNLTNTVFSSTATQSLPATGAPFTGTYKPDGVVGIGPTAYPSTVSGFAGLYSKGNGAWTIAINDNAALDAGTLTNWSITITYQIVTPTITWTPVAGLYTNAGATTPYTAGSNALSVYANPPATSTYTVTATTPAGCTASATTTVTVSPYPVVTVGSIPDTVCISDPVIPLSANPTGGSWSGPGVSGNNFIPPATAVGTYTLTYSYTSPAGCTSTATKKIAVKECPERMILLRDNAVQLYPNPNTGRFNIRINSVLYNNLVMKVYASNGTLLNTQQLGGLAWGRILPIDLSYLPGGVYMVKFYYDGGVRTSEKTFKVIIANP